MDLRTGQPFVRGKRYVIDGLLVGTTPRGRRPVLRYRSHDLATARPVGRAPSGSPAKVERLR